jgi:IS30 family transposase
MERKKYERLTLKERVIIETLLSEKRGKSYIAKKLNRARSTIGREINLWVKNPRDRYDAALAHWCARDDNANKRVQAKIDLNPRLKINVYKGLLNKDSPELIAGRLRLAFPDDPSMQLSHESIYRHIYAHPQGQTNRKLIKLLVRHKPRRLKRGKGGRAGGIKDRVSIDLRPQCIENRQEVGHWEGDLIIGPRQASCIGSIVERKTRYVLLLKLDNKKSETVTNAFANELNLFHELLRKSLTYDNGKEMAFHRTFTLATGMSVYFAHPYSSWERGTNENTNGLVRRYYPKKTDFNLLSERQLKTLQDRLNNRPRKVLGYRTANEMMQLEMNTIYKDNDDAKVLEMGNKSLSDLFSFLIPQSKKS